MKFLRTMGLIIFKVGLSIGVMCLLLSFSIRSFVKESTSIVLSNNSQVVEAFDSMGIESNKIQEFMKSEEAQEFIISYVSPVLDGNIDLDNVDIGSDILEFVKSNEAQIEDIIGEPLPMEQIEDYVSSKDMDKLNEAYKTVVVDISKNVPTEVKNTISVFGYFLSVEFRLLIVGWCLFTLIVIALLQWSFYLWIRTLGNTLTWCGVLLSLIPIVGSLFVTGMFNVMNVQFELDFEDAFYSSLVAIIIGVVCLVIYVVIKKVITKEGEKNEISEVSF